MAGRGVGLSASVMAGPGSQSCSLAPFGSVVLNRRILLPDYVRATLISSPPLPRLSLAMEFRTFQTCCRIQPFILTRGSRD